MKLLIYYSISTLLIPVYFGDFHWFRWFLDPTSLYIDDFINIYNLPLSSTVISMTTLPYPSLHERFRWFPYPSLSILVISIVISQCNPSVHRWFQQFLYPAPIYNGDFGDCCTLPISTLVISVISIPCLYLFWCFRWVPWWLISQCNLCTSVISTISLPCPYLQPWFRWLLYIGDFSIQPLCISEIATIFIPDPSLHQWFR